jgi:predicted DCC family thiol-disulfide oxidoreductase YuxK
MEQLAMQCRETTYSFRIVCDETCALVSKLAAVIKVWDRTKKFTFIERDCALDENRNLISQFDSSPWSLVLFDDMNYRWEGPEAIPIILKNLPGGKIAVVFYCLPGTMWLTRQLYLLVSRNRRRFVHRHSI